MCFFMREGDITDTFCNVILTLLHVWAGKMTANTNPKSESGTAELDNYRCTPHVLDLFFIVREGRVGTEGLKAREPPREKRRRDIRD